MRARFLVMAASLLLAGCLITVPGVYFESEDFTPLASLSGDWKSVPEESTDKGEEIVRLRFISAGGNMERAEMLSANGLVDKTNDPADFGLVDIGAGRYIVAETEEDGDAVQSGYLAVEIADRRLAFYVFDGGDSDAAKAAFAAELAKYGLSLDPGRPGEAHLSGAITKDKIKSLFSDLLADPALYEPDISVFRKYR